MKHCNGKILKLSTQEPSSEEKEKIFDPQCVNLPKKQVILKKENYLSEFSKENEKAEARSNLGITPLLEELKALINAKLIDKTGNLKFGLELTDRIQNP